MLPIVILALALASQTLIPFAKVEHPPINEMSGIVASRRYPGVFWVHNDSGDAARIFAINRDGKVVVPTWLQQQADFPGVQIQTAANSDWEDIATDGDNLYLADVGNNGNARRDLGVYVVPEPNPYEIPQSRPTAWYHVVYPDQKEFPPKGVKPFDCEAAFWLYGKLHFVTKTRNPAGMPLGEAGLYRMETRHNDRPNVLRKLDEKRDLGGWVTAADVSPDGKTLAILTHFPISSVWFFDANAPNSRMLSQGKGRQVVFTGAQQCEAVAWDGNDSVIVTNEQRGMFRISAPRS